MFEGLRLYDTARGPAVFQLGPHVRRLFNSCRILRMELPYTEEQVAQAIVETVRRNGLKSGYIRPLAYKGVGTIGLDRATAPTEMVIFAVEFGPYLGRRPSSKAWM